MKSILATTLLMVSVQSFAVTDCENAIIDVSKVSFDTGIKKEASKAAESNAAQINSAYWRNEARRTKAEYYESVEKTQEKVQEAKDICN